MISKLPLPAVRPSAELTREVILGLFCYTLLLIEVVCGFVNATLCFMQVFRQVGDRD